MQALSTCQVPPRLRTLTAFSAESIARSYRRWLFPRHSPREVVLSGGGVFNLTLLEELRERLSPLPLRLVDEWGIHPQAKEPLAFAILAVERLAGKVNHLPSATGARRQVSLGKICHP